MPMLRFTTWIVIVTACFGCSRKVTVTEHNYVDYFSLPGVYYIDNDLMCDETEATNFHWMEYLYWLKRIYGDSSDQYLAALPNQHVWIEADSCLSSYMNDIYLRHPVYRDYPLVGVTQEQAEKYSQWRSDRVFEYMLIALKIIEYNPDQTDSMHFSIENYFAGKYMGLEPSRNFDSVPHYRLPTLEERAKILAYQNSLDSAYYAKCRSKACKECKASQPEWNVGVDPCPNDSTHNEPLRYVYTGCVPKKSRSLYNLHGNVAEWTAVNGIAVGGGWKDSLERIQQSDTAHLWTSNAWTGFRNVCVWIDAPK